MLGVWGGTGAPHPQGSPERAPFRRGSLGTFAGRGLQGRQRCASRWLYCSLWFPALSPPQIGRLPEWGHGAPPQVPVLPFPWAEGPRGTQRSQGHPWRCRHSHITWVKSAPYFSERLQTPPDATSSKIPKHCYDHIPSAVPRGTQPKPSYGCVLKPSCSSTPKPSPQDTGQGTGMSGSPSQSPQLRRLASPALPSLVSCWGGDPSPSCAAPALLSLPQGAAQGHIPTAASWRTQPVSAPTIRVSPPRRGRH